MGASNQRHLRAAAWLAPLPLAALLASCAKGPEQGWAGAQRRYLQAAGAVAFEPGPRETEAAERCLTCHLGMDPLLRPVSAERLFEAHPAIPAHEASELGCVACHGGEARALELEEAHGRLANSAEPLLPPRLTQARCGSCHAELLAHGRSPQSGGAESGRAEGPAAFAVAAPRLLAGARAFHESGCLGCHRVDGLGASLARELSGVGRPASVLLTFASDFRAGMTWNKLLWHFEEPLAVAPLGALPPITREQADRFESLQTYLLSLRSPRLGEAVERGFHLDDGEETYRLLCAVCHGPEAQGLDWTGRSRWVPGLGRTGHASLAGPRLLREAIADGTPERGMPAWRSDRGGLGPGEIDALAVWLESSRPPGPVLGALLSPAGEPARGREIHARRCAACHGAAGEGGAFGPAIAGGESSLEDWFSALVEGRPESGMPPFAALAPADLRDLVALRRSGEPWGADSAASAEGGALETPSPPAGSSAAELFATRCASCHGPRGEGALASSLRAEQWQRSATDAQVTMAILAGRPGAETPTWEHAGGPALTAEEAIALTGFLRSLRAPAPGAREAPQ